MVGTSGCEVGRARDGPGLHHLLSTTPGARPGSGPPPLKGTTTIERYTVHYPSFSNPDFPGGLDNWRVFRSLQDAVRFATDTQATLRRTAGAPGGLDGRRIDGPADAK